MTNEERFHRMTNCVYHRPDGFLCRMYGRQPLDCGSCEEYAAVSKDKDDDGCGVCDFENVRVFVPAGELWDFYTQNKGRLQDEMVLVAENTETGYAVYITDDGDTPMLSVCKGDKEAEHEEYVMDSDDCAKTAKRLFLLYLVPFTVSGDSCLSTQDMEDEMYEREDELDLAINDFLAAVLREPDGDAVSETFGSDFVQEVLHHILEYLTNEHCIKIFRPMLFTDDETGREVYSLFPYEEYTFSDNELHKKNGG